MIGGIFIGFEGSLPKRELEELVKKVEDVTGYGAEILEMDKSTHSALLVDDASEVQDDGD